MRLCFRGEVQPLMSNALLAEFEALLGRDRLFEGSPLNGEQRSAFMNDFLSVCRWVNIYYLWRPNLRDEGDNHLVELAVAGSATHIVTGNIKDFRGMELLFPQLTITTANAFLSERSM